MNRDKSAVHRWGYCSSPERSLISLENVNYSYPTLESNRFTLRDISMSFRVGQSVSIVGPSGCGKSTLLNILGLLDVPDSGNVCYAGVNMTCQNSKIRADARKSFIGFVFQGFNLLPRLDALNNVALPLLYRGLPRTECRMRAQVELERVGLADRINCLPADLSGGQRQRVSIARALVGDPPVLLADEPTASLDQKNAQDIVELLLNLKQERGTTLVIVTHDNYVASQMERCIQISDGEAHELCTTRI